MFIQNEGDIIAKRKFVRARTAEGRRKQIAAIRRNYAQKNKVVKKIEKSFEAKNISKAEDMSKVEKEVFEGNNKFPSEFPFWARLKINKNRTTLVIDEEYSLNKKTGKEEETFVHRESIHTEKKDYEKIFPNPDIDDPDPMYLKRPSKLPKTLFKPHNKKLNMPEHLKERYGKNNK